MQERERACPRVCVRVRVSGRGHGQSPRGMGGEKHLPPSEMQGAGGHAELQIEPQGKAFRVNKEALCPKI